MRSVSHHLTSFCRDTSGATAIMSAIVVPVLVGVAALGVDFGSLYLERRELQGVADLAAIAAAANLDNAEKAALATLAANRINASAFGLVKGNYEADPTVPPASRFKPGIEPTNAVKVDVTRSSRLNFGRIFGVEAFNLRVTAISASSAQAMFSVGSRLLAVRDGVPNLLLSGLTGTTLNLSVMDYEALLNARVEVAPFLKALATELNITAGTYDDVLRSSASIEKVATAAANVTAASGDSAATLALRQMATDSRGSQLRVPLQSLISLGSFASISLAEQKPGFVGQVNALELLSAAIAVANGQNQVALNLKTGVPGLLSLKLEIAIGERAQKSAWVSVGGPGSILRTAQTRIKLVAEVGGTGVLAGTVIRLPVYVEIAYAEGRLANVTCTNADRSTNVAKVGVKPGIAKAWIGDVATSKLSDFSSSLSVSDARVVDTALIDVKVRAYAEIGNQSETMLTFTQQDVDDLALKRVETTDFVDALVQTLVKRARIEVDVAGLSLVTPTAINQAVAQALAIAAAPVDEVLSQTIKLLGVHLGEADVRVHGIRCGAAALAG